MEIHPPRAAHWKIPVGSSGRGSCPLELRRPPRGVGADDDDDDDDDGDDDEDADDDDADVRMLLMMMMILFSHAPMLHEKAYGLAARELTTDDDGGGEGPVSAPN